jgi:hypothetical protein
MELAGIRNDSESQKGGFETIGDNPRISAANILQSPFRLAAETNRPAVYAPGTERKFEFLLTKIQSELFSLFCDKRTSLMRGWCSSRLRVEPIFGQIY